MDSSIKKSQLILLRRLPFSAEARAEIKALNKTDWIYSSLRLDSYEINIETVRTLLDGDWSKEVSLNLHSLISNYSEMIENLIKLEETKYDMSERYINEIHGALVSPDESRYRDKNIAIKSIGYNPPHFKEIEFEMKGFFRSYFVASNDLDPIEQAILLHNRLIAVYPFETQMEAVARSAAQYILMLNDLPPVDWTISLKDYNDSIRSFLRREESDVLYNHISEELNLKLKAILQITK